MVGESGSGKSLTLRALMGLLPPGVRAERGVVELAGEPLPFAGPRARSVRRGRLAMVFQDPLSGLDPVHTVGAQVAEVPRRVLGEPAAASRRRAVELLRLVGMPDPERRSHAFPHQLSGGMRQRVLIAMALASEPKVLLCDEPTTALDVTVQAQVLELLDDVRRRLGVAVVFVSHDLAVVRQMCDRLAVMYTGRLVETGRCRRRPRPPRSSVHPRPARGGRGPRRRGPHAGDDTGDVAGPGPRAGRLPVPSPVSFRQRGLCPGGASVPLPERPPMGHRRGGDRRGWHGEEGTAARRAPAARPGAQPASTLNG